MEARAGSLPTAILTRRQYIEGMKKCHAWGVGVTMSIKGSGSLAIREDGRKRVRRAGGKVVIDGATLQSLLWASEQAEGHGGVVPKSATECRVFSDGASKPKRLLQSTQEVSIGWVGVCAWGLGTLVSM